MGYLEIVITALALSMDACAVAVTLGFSIKKSWLKKALIIGGYFGFFQGAMPLIGYFVAKLFSNKISDYAPWIAFALLLFLGVKMIWESFKKEELFCKDRECPAAVCSDRDCPKNPAETSVHPKKMIPFALATSIDALAVGVTFAMLDVEIYSGVAIIAAVTFSLSAVAVKIGSLFGTKIKNKAELFGGIVLILVGLKIVIEHLFF